MVAQPQQVEWLSLVETSGPFLTLTVLEQAFPQGLESIETPRCQRLRYAYSEWRDAVDEDDELLPQLHDAWVNLVLTELLEFDEESATPRSSWVGGDLSISSSDGAAHYGPTWIIHAPGSTDPRAFIAVTHPDADLESAAQTDDWIASEVERMTLLCREHGVRVGIVTNGESWVLINAPADAPSGKAVWRSRFWFQEPATLKAFQSLLGVRRCFGPTDQTLEALLDESLKHQEEVTDTLGEQVRRATEVLIQALDKADQDRNRELLRDVPPTLLYEASLTVMMRLVFVLCAEERGLFLLGDPVYDENLAVSTLRGKLAEEADQLGDEVLERRFDAWARLLAAFRAVYAGIEHEDLRLSAMGGSLFDPDRYPFLEGRAMGTSWLETTSQPLPIDNRTVLLLLNSLQVLEQSHGALSLSYRALDVEQIGHVYEGLLDHTVVRVPDITLGLEGSAKNRYPTMSLAELESLRFEHQDTLVSKIAEETGRTPTTIGKALTRPASDTVRAALLSASNGNGALFERIAPFANLVRNDAWGEPIIYEAHSFMVTPGAHRRESGTHYTPRSLTEQIVRVALEPLVYVGPAEGRARDHWALKTSGALLDLRICDPAMGSGAFLVQTCRYLGDLLIEAWARAEADGLVVTSDGSTLEALGSHEPMPRNLNERIVVARRLIAERCLYGVDINPLAVELAKLSIWLVTLAKGRPFGFLDHNLRPGDSLLGMHSAGQLASFSMSASLDVHVQPTVFTQVVEDAIAEALALRRQLRATDVADILDVENMAALDRMARARTQQVSLLADAVLAETIRCEGKKRLLRAALSHVSTTAMDFLDGHEEATRAISSIIRDGLPTERPFHWFLEFPEVFDGDNPGFDAVLGNPPYINAVEMYLGDSPVARKKYYSRHFAAAVGSYDAFVLFYERAMTVAAFVSTIAMLIPNKVLSAEYAETLRDQIVSTSAVYALIDFSTADAFSASVYPVALVITKPCVDMNCVVLDASSSVRSVASQSSLQTAPRHLWSFLLTDFADLLGEALSASVDLGNYFDVSASATVSEAYEIAPFVRSNRDEALPPGHARFIVSGNVRRSATNWADSPVRYLKERYVFASVDLSGLPSARRLQTRTPKLIISGMAKRPTAFFDAVGEYCAGVSTVIVIQADEEGISLETLEHVLNSRAGALIYKGLYAGLSLAGGYLRFGSPQIAAFPIPKRLAQKRSYEAELDDDEVARLYGLEPEIVDAAFVRNFGEGALTSAHDEPSTNE